MRAHGQFARYAVVGVTSNLLLYLAYLLLSSIGIEYMQAMTMAYVAGVLISFFANRSWSFRFVGRARDAFARYLIAYGAGYLINVTILWAGVHVLSWPHEFVQAGAILIVAISLFVMHRYWVFPAVLRN